MNSGIKDNWGKIIKNMYTHKQSIKTTGQCQLFALKSNFVYSTEYSTKKNFVECSRKCVLFLLFIVLIKRAPDQMYWLISVRTVSYGKLTIFRLPVVDLFTHIIYQITTMGWICSLQGAFIETNFLFLRYYCKILIN